MTNSQQAEALAFFRTNAERWKDSVRNSDEQIVNVSRQRNDYVMRVARLTGARTALDVGCGSGELVLSMAATGLEAAGIDFAPEMIRIAEETARAKAVAGARFACASVFDLPEDGRRFDLISANGFIEYISPTELNRFIAIARGLLTKGGSLVLGSRNRLFNAFSLNRFTEEELRGGQLPALVEESLIWTSSRTVEEALGRDRSEVRPADFAQPNTGIDVTVRHQFTPLQLSRLLGDRGFSIADIAPIHIHGVTVGFKDSHPEIHTMISNLLQDSSQGTLSLLPISSSFMIRGVCS